MAEHALIATLEADLTGGVSQCNRVRKNPKGACQCAGYGPRGSGPTFKQLCAEKKLPIVIGSKEFYNSGGDKMARALALPPPMDFAPMDGYDDDLGFFERVLDPEMTKPMAMALGGGFLGGIAYDYISEMSYFDKSWKKMLLSAGLGIAGGFALWGDHGPDGAVDADTHMRRNIAKGHMGAMGHILGKELVGYLKGMGSTKAATEGMNYFQPSRRNHQLRDAQVETRAPAFQGFADVDVEPESQLAEVATWIS